MVVNNNLIYVVDASFILAFLLGENNLIVNNAFSAYSIGKITFISNPLLSFEVGNGIRTAVLRKRISKKQAVILFENFLKLKITEEKTDYQSNLALAINRNLTFYDASYLQLARQLKVKLLSLDTIQQK